MPFFPQTGRFFELFIELATTVHQASLTLSQIKIGSSTNKKLALRVQKLELQADEYMHLLKHEADRSFLTPIDREDIHALANSLNVILDHIENVTSGVFLLSIKGNGHEFKEYVELITESSELLLELMKDLEHKSKYVNRMKVTIQTIHQLEKRGDELTRSALLNLFLHTKNAVTIIKWKHVYDNLEQTLDACESTADTVEDIIIKNF